MNIPLEFLTNSYLAGEYETEQDGDGELAVTEEDDVEEVRVGWVLQEKPAKIFHIIKILSSTINIAVKP